MNFNELMRRMVELDQPTNERVTGGQPTPQGTNRLTGQPLAPAAPEPDHLAEPPMRAPVDPNAPNAFANKTRMPDPAAAARAQRSSTANDLANQQQPKEGNAFSGALDAARDSGQSEFEVDGKQYKVHEDGSVEECGMGMGSSMPAPKQSDSVTMNVSMNGSGAGGIRDLMQILRSIESGDEGPENFGDKDMDVVFKKMAGPDTDSMKLIGDEFRNEPDEMYSDINYDGGGDLNRPKGAYAMANPGDNPMAVENIRQRLEQQYKIIKESSWMPKPEVYPPPANAKGWEATKPWARRVVNVVTNTVLKKMEPPKYIKIVGNSQYGDPVQMLISGIEKIVGKYCPADEDVYEKWKFAAGEASNAALEQSNLKFQTVGITSRMDAKELDNAYVAYLGAFEAGLKKIAGQFQTPGTSDAGPGQASSGFSSSDPRRIGQRSAAANDLANQQSPAR